MPDTTATTSSQRGDLERSVLTVLWEHPDGSTARDVRERLERPELALTTVLTVLGRLTAKGLVRRDDDRRPHRYFAARTREDFLSELMADVLGQAPDRGAVLNRFVGSITADDHETLRRAVRRRPGSAT